MLVPGFVTDNQLMESMVVEAAMYPAPEKRHVSSVLVKLTTQLPDSEPVLDTLHAKKVGTPRQLQISTLVVPISKHAARATPQVLQTLRCAWLKIYHLLGCRSLCTCAGWQLGAVTCRPAQARHS